VLPAYASDPEIVRQLEREARLASGLRHGNVVTVLDYGTIDGCPYLALELVEGVDLRALLARAEGRRLSGEVVALLAIDVAEALDHAHRAKSDDAPEGIVHRDVSPSNVLLDVSGGVRLADFGVAKAMKQSAATVSGTVRGKIPYMAPEHIRGERTDGRTDLFALGVVLYEALAGERPFDGTHDVETMTRVLAASRKPLIERVPDVDPAFAAIVERLLAADPADRFASAAALLEALAPLAPPPSARRDLAARVREANDARTRTEQRELGEATTVPGARDPAPPEEAPLPARVASPPRHRGRVLIPGIALGLLLVGASMWIGRARDRVPAPQPAVAAAGPQPVPAPQQAVAAAAPPAPPPVPVVDASVPIAEGTLQVAVTPWGQVWIDGKFMGRAPVVTRVSAGTHVVAAGVDRPSVRRRVQVTADRTQRVVLEVPDR
jgi:hypothetical protein